MQSKRLTLINDQPKFSGIGQYSQDLVKILTSEGYEVTYVSIDCDQGNRQHLNTVCAADPFKNFRFKFSFYNLSTFNIRALHSYVGGFVHITSQYLVPLGIKNKNVAVTVHDLNKLHIFGVDFITRTFITLKSCLLGKYKLISAPSHYVKNDILSHFKTDEESIYVMYNFIDLTKIDASRFNNSENANNSTILHVGSDMPNKNINLIYKILKVLPSSFKLIRVGANSQRNLKYAKDNDLLKRIIFYEGVSTEVLNDLYRTSSVFLYPSKFEGFGRPLLEAMAHGLPVVYRNSSSLPEIAGDAGLPFDTDDVKEVVELIYKSIDNPENERLRRRSLERSKFFDLKSQRDNILKFYELLLEP